MLKPYVSWQIIKQVMTSKTQKYEHNFLFYLFFLNNRNRYKIKNICAI